MIPRTRLGGSYEISRVIKGGWHLAGGHGAVDPATAKADMARFVEAGITTFDCADIYTGVEALIGDFLRDSPATRQRVQIHTKFVPDLADLATADRAYVERRIDRSLRRLGVERLDLVQFHWWDYALPRYVEVALELDRLRRAGKIAHLAATNFDLPRLGAIVAAGVPVVAHQVQYSLLDDRPGNGMVEWCATRRIGLLCYGTVAGGFLSERWLGLAEPTELRGNRSLVKYKLVIDDFGGWALFQSLLAVLASIARREGTDIASVATAAVLAKRGVAAVIVGATSSAHLAAHGRLAGLALSAEDQAAIEAVLAHRRGPRGDVYALERDREGPHGRIMQYNLGRDGAAN